MADERGNCRFRLPWKRVPAAVQGDGRAVPADWRRTIRSRLLVAAALMAVWAAAIEARLIYLQVFQHDELMVRAARLQLRTIDAPAKRGDIIDRNGRLLAYSVDVESIFADPSQIEDPEGTAMRLCTALEGCSTAEMTKRLRRDGQFAWIARKVSPEEAQRIRALELDGIAVLTESRRFYPKRELLANVLGYVGVDNDGMAGLESTFDAQVRGRVGKVLINVDARRHVLASRVERPPTAGASLELTIDQYLQNIAERELRAGVEENGAAGGSVVVMDPHSGEVLALANWPTFNPNTYNRSHPEVRRNRAIQDLYEPGSTFKVVTASAALEERVIGPGDPVECAPGHITFGSRVIRDVHSYGVLSFTDVIVKSSNVGAIKVGLRLGPERLGRYITRFGFGQQTSTHFAGENRGIVWNPAHLNDSALASVAMGYQIGVTPLQMAAAVSSVANGGTLYEPHIVRAFIKDSRRVEVGPKALRRTISAETAAELVAMLEGVVERGTAKVARIDGYTIAGKTGTAQKLVNGRYSKSEYNASFVGFLPSRNPVLTITVVIDSPRRKGYYGGVVAAPIFKRIAEASLRHLGVGPTIDAPPPVLVARSSGDALAIAPRPVRAELLERAIAPARAGLMPDLRGLSAREAVRTLTRLGMSARITGDGLVVEQSPAVGSLLGPGEVCVLTLGRQLPDAMSWGAGH